MTWGIAVICIEAALILLTFPVKIGVKAHASLDRKSMQLNLSILQIPVMRLRVNLDKSPYIELNGKEIERNGQRKISVAGIKRLCAYVKSENIIKYSLMPMLVAFDDAKSSAIVCALIAMIPLNMRIFMGERERFDVDCDVIAEINLLQTLKIIKIINGNEKNAKFR